MRVLRRTTRFKKDLKREKRGRYRHTLEADLLAVLELLLEDKLLPESYKDHALTGNWQGFRDHIKPDLVLIYRKTIDQDNVSVLEILELARVGSHSELGL